MAEKQNLDSLQQEVLESQLRTQKAILAREEAALEDTMEALADRKQKKERARRTNADRQRQFALDRDNQRHLQQNVCEHRAGGYAGEEDFYRPINEWIAGYGLVSAHSLTPQTTRIAQGASA